MMNSVRPEDRPKAIALVALVVVVFGLVAFRLNSVLGGGGSPPPPEGVAAATPPDSGGAAPDGAQTAALPTGTGSTAETVELIDPPDASMVPTLDPFRLVVHPIPPKVERPPVLTMRPDTRASSNFSPMKGEILPMPVEGANIQPTAVPAEETIRVMGIVSGDEGIAVIRVGSVDHVVRTGDSFAGGIRLVSVSESQVVVRQGKSVRTYKVGATPASGG